MPVFEPLAEAMNEGVIMVDAGWQVIYANRQARLLFRRPDLSLPLPLQDLIPDEPTTTTWRDLDRAMKQQVPAELDVFYPALFAWHNVRAFPHDGGLGLILSNITDRQWSLQKDMERGYLRTLFKDAPVAVSVTHGREHSFNFANEFATRLVGNRDIEGRTLRDAFPDLAGQGFYELYDQVYMTGERFEGTESPAQLTDPYTGEMKALYVNLSLIPVRGFDNQVAGVLSISVDVTSYVVAAQA
ncbi:hypothetical protein GCM10008955_32260 [Deinococcus malanensis]|uniref:PAS domain-containing protein n=1 Tax=Deinococcus malanensis TaxID=1706855 RepID=A0ABQ2F0V1_9DEIO|nr:PAS domain-containing protein [Deinococcus malanensis]GGK35863.1 hypothetical protein GCM10008955_32260 [Deinococcus malanensis]